MNINDDFITRVGEVGGVDVGTEALLAFIDLWK